MRRNPNNEERIGNAIAKLFKDKELAMNKNIEDAIYENREIYLKFREAYAEKLSQLDSERASIKKSKKKKKNKGQMKMLSENSRDRFIYISFAVNLTYKHFRKLYFENDYYRQKKFKEIVGKVYSFS